MEKVNENRKILAIPSKRSSAFSGTLCAAGTMIPAALNWLTQCRQTTVVLGVSGIVVPKTQSRIPI